MDHNKLSLNERTKDYFSRSKEKIIQSHNNWVSTINSFSNEDGQITLTMDNTQIIHSINISEKLLVDSNKKELFDRWTRFINEAIIKAGKNAAREMQNAISAEEYGKILSDEKKEIQDQFELLIKKNNLSIQRLSSIKRTVVSASGNVTIIIFGNRIIHSIFITEECFSKGNNTIEKELMETVNKALREVMESVQGSIKRNEEDLNKTIFQE
jgi:DNA-binding protein YbaB